MLMAFFGFIAATYTAVCFLASMVNLVRDKDPAAKAATAFFGITAYYAAANFIADLLGLIG